MIRRTNRREQKEGASVAEKATPPREADQRDVKGMPAISGLGRGFERRRAGMDTT